MVSSSLHCFHSRAKASIAKKSSRVMVSGSINLAETLSNNPEFMQLKYKFSALTTRSASRILLANGVVRCACSSIPRAIAVTLNVCKTMLTPGVLLKVNKEVVSETFVV